MTTVEVVEGTKWPRDLKWPLLKERIDWYYKNCVKILRNFVNQELDKAIHA